MQARAAFDAREGRGCDRERLFDFRHPMDRRGVKDMMRKQWIAQIKDGSGKAVFAAK